MWAARSGRGMPRPMAQPSSSCTATSAFVVVAKGIVPVARSSIRTPTQQAASIRHLPRLRANLRPKAAPVPGKNCFPVSAMTPKAMTRLTQKRAPGPNRVRAGQANQRQTQYAERLACNQRPAFSTHPRHKYPQLTACRHHRRPLKLIHRTSLQLETP